MDFKSDGNNMIKKKQLITSSLIILLVLSTSFTVYYLGKPREEISHTVVNDPERGVSWHDMDVTPEGTVYVTWTSRENIYISHSEDHGSTFSEDIEITPSVSFDPESPPFIIARNDSEAWIIWEGIKEVDRSNNRTEKTLYRLYVSKLDRHEKEFSYTTLVNESKDKSPGLLGVGVIPLFHNRSFYMIWNNPMNGSISVKRSFDKGRTFNRSMWLEPPLLRKYPTTLIGMDPIAAINREGEIHIVWGVNYRRENELEYSHQLFHAYSGDKGKSFTLQKINNTLEDVSFRSPELSLPSISAGNDGDFYLSFAGVNMEENRSGLYFSKVTDEGKLIDGVEVSSMSGSWPEMDIGRDGMIYIIWKEGGEIYFTKSTNEGESFGEKINVTPQNTNVFFHTIGAAKNVYIGMYAGEEARNIYFVKNPEPPDKIKPLRIAVPMTIIVACSTALIWRWKKYGELW